MGYVERIQSASTESDRATRQRTVPSDWFLDPADPEAGRRYSSVEGLDEAATALLESHPETETFAPVTEMPSSAERTGHQVWIPLGTFPGQEEEGELGWQTESLCAQTDPEAFFPEKGGSTRDAKKVCSGCTVRSECLEYALKNDERFGIWGGLSERERRRLRKRAN